MVLQIDWEAYSATCDTAVRCNWKTQVAMLLVGPFTL